MEKANDEISQRRNKSIAKEDGYAKLPQEA